MNTPVEPGERSRLFTFTISTASISISATSPSNIDMNHDILSSWFNGVQPYLPFPISSKQ